MSNLILTEEELKQRLFCNCRKPILMFHQTKPYSYCMICEKKIGGFIK